MFQTNSGRSLILLKFCLHTVILDTFLLHPSPSTCGRASPGYCCPALQWQPAFPLLSGYGGWECRGEVSITTRNESRPEAMQELLLFTSTNGVTARRLILQQGSGTREHRCRSEPVAAARL